MIANIKDFDKNTPEEVTASTRASHFQDCTNILYQRNEEIE